MNFPSQHSRGPEEPVQQSEPASDEFPPVAPDAPPLRAEEFDPVWIAETQAEQRDALTQQDLDRLEQIITSEHFRIRQRRFPNFTPPPPAAQKGAGFRWTLGTFAVLLLTSSVIALNATGRFPLPQQWANSVADGGAKIAGALSPDAEGRPVEEKAPLEVSTPPATQQPAPRLVVKGASAEDNEQILLGVAVDNPHDGLTAIVSGLAQGTTLTEGKAWGATGWIVPASALATTYLRPPSGFTGTMEYTVALQTPDGTDVDRQSMRLEWLTEDAREPAPPPQDSAQPNAPPVASPKVAARELEPQEIESMIKRGEDLLNTGDVASARLLLRRAAEARDARAALALAASYDPIVLKRLGVYGSQPDLATARDWYEKAKQYGSREAPQRLELLASQYR